MIKLFTTLTLALFLAQTVSAQTDQFWGMTSSGGNDYAGTIFSTNTDGTNLQVRYAFPSSTPGTSTEKMQMTLYNGKLYGTTYAGGVNNAGIIFSYDPATNAYNRLFDFSLTNGTVPNSNLVLFNNKFYGTTQGGGGGAINAINGVLFEFDPTTSVFTKKLDFTGTSGLVPGGSPIGSMTVYNNRLYGTTYNGGNFNSGVLFEYNPATNAYIKKLDFSTANGTAPLGNLIVHNNKIYGTCNGGGSSGNGVIFEYDALAGIYTVRKNMTTADGTGPVAGVTAYNGKLYGVNQYGGANGAGTLYEYDPVTFLYTKKIDFSVAGGTYNSSELLVYNDLLYGVSRQGGANDGGVVFKYNPVTNGYTKTYDFSINTGSGTYGGFALAGNKLYAVTKGGGINNSGVLFEYNPATDMYVKKLDFFQTNGSHPVGSLLYYNAKFYGLTETGGANGAGVLFEFNPVGNVFTKLYDFSVLSGYGPTGTLVVKNGKLYGLLDNCWVNGNSSQDFGAVFSFDLSTNTFTRQTFSFGNGAHPRGHLAEEPSGNFIGVAQFGPSAGGGGVLFRYNHATNVITGLQNFIPAAGSSPQDIIAYNGSYYILCALGGNSGSGSIIEYSGNLFNRASFSSTLGRSPSGFLTPYNNKLYALAGYGGNANDNGTLVEFTPQSPYTLTKKMDFTGANGRTPNGSLLLYNNKFYGMTNYGGTAVYDPAGVLFEYDPATGIYTKKAEFLNSNGAHPVYTTLIAAPTGPSLPLTLINVTARRKTGSEIFVEWQTASEQNTSHFNVERSIDGTNFTAIGKVAASGHSASVTSYSFTDAQPLAAMAYYRLKMADKDGSFTHSKVVSVTYKNDGSYAVYPNPATNEIWLKGNGATEVQLHATDGRLVLRQQIVQAEVSVSLSTLPKGIYQLSLWNNGVRQQRMQLIKQ